METTKLLKKSRAHSPRFLHQPIGLGHGARLCQIAGMLAGTQRDSLVRFAGSRYVQSESTGFPESLENEPSATIFVVGHLARRLLRSRARGDGTGRKRGAKVNWPSVCLSPAGSHGNGLSCVPHANTGVHSNKSVVSVQATVSFIITFRKGTSPYR